MQKWNVHMMIRMLSFKINRFYQQKCDKFKNVFVIKKSHSLFQFLLSFSFPKNKNNIPLHSTFLLFIIITLNRGTHTNAKHIIQFMTVAFTLIYIKIQIDSINLSLLYSSEFLFAFHFLI